MRIRTVKPEFFQHEMHGRISQEASFLAIGLLCLADDEGRFKLLPAMIRSLLFTARNLTTEQVETALKELAKVRWFFAYIAEIDGEEVQIGQIITFRRHQNINKPQKSRYPDPLPSDSVPKNVALPSDSVPKNVALPSDSVPKNVALPSDSVPKNSTPKTPCSDDYVPTTGGRKEGRKERKESRARDTHTEFLEPVLEDVLTYAGCQSIPEACARKWFFDEKGAGWIDGKGRAYTDWQSKLQGFAESWRIIEEKNRPKPGQKGSQDELRGQLEAELEGERDPEKRAALKTKLKKMGGMGSA